MTLTVSGVVDGLDSLLQLRETIPIEVQGLKEVITMTI